MSILNSSKIKLRLDNGELLKNGTWEMDNLRHVAYDLRVADDFMVIPDGNSNTKAYQKGEKRNKPIILRPGDVAFLSSQEKICIPFDVCANIGIKFSYARQGVLVLTGLLVDPGYGLKKTASGNWIPKDDERIHVLLANLGSNEVVINPGKDKLLSIQFFEIDDNFTPSHTESGQDMFDEFFKNSDNNKEGGLVFFKNATEAMGKVNKIDNRFETLEKSTNQIVMFGIYLISAGLFTGLLTYLFTLIGNDKIVDKISKIHTIFPTNLTQAICYIITIIIGYLVFDKIFKFATNIIFRKSIS